jgi:hypothetical protein
MKNGMVLFQNLIIKNYESFLTIMEQSQDYDYIMGPRGSNGNEMHIIFLHGPSLRLLR